MMQRFLIAANLNGQVEALQGLQAQLRERRPDGVLFGGGFLGNAAAGQAERLKKWKECLDALGKLGIFTAFLPGTYDVPSREFLALAKDAEVEHPTLRSAHATTWEETHLSVCGVGGELTEAEDRMEDKLCVSRGLAEYWLRLLWRAEQQYKVLLLSVSPPGELGGAAGNRICGDFIDSYHPTLCVVAGATECRGVQRIGHTLVVNPGRLSDGSAAWLDWGRPGAEQVEFLGR